MPHAKGKRLEKRCSSELQSFEQEFGALQVLLVASVQHKRVLCLQERLDLLADVFHGSRDAAATELLLERAQQDNRHLLEHDCVVAFVGLLNVVVVLHVANSRQHRVAYFRVVTASEVRNKRGAQEPERTVSTAQSSCNISGLGGDRRGERLHSGREHVQLGELIFRSLLEESPFDQEVSEDALRTFVRGVSSNQGGAGGGGGGGGELAPSRRPLRSRSK